MTLYEINERIMDAVANCVDIETGEIVGDTEELEALEMARDDKLDNIACLIKNIKAEAEAIKAEKMKLAARQASAEKKAEWLENYLIRNMMPGETLNRSRVVIRWRRSESVAVDNVDALPDGYFVTKKEPNKTIIKNALKAGIEVPGAALVEKQNIQIR